MISIKQERVEIRLSKDKDGPLKSSRTTQIQVSSCPCNISSKSRIYFDPIKAIGNNNRRFENVGAKWLDKGRKNDELASGTNWNVSHKLKLTSKSFLTLPCPTFLKAWVGRLRTTDILTILPLSINFMCSFFVSERIRNNVVDFQISRVFPDDQQFRLPNLRQSYAFMLFSYTRHH